MGDKDAENKSTSIVDIENIVSRLRSDISITDIVLLSGVIGNLAAYAYKYGYFLYYKIPSTLISFSLYEVAIYSCFSFFYVFIINFVNLFGMPRDKEFDKELKGVLSSKNIFVFQLICLILITAIYGFLLFFMSLNLSFALIQTLLLIVILAIILAINNLVSLKANNKKEETETGSKKDSGESNCDSKKTTSEFSDEIKKLTKTLEEIKKRRNAILKPLNIISFTIIVSIVVSLVTFLGYQLGEYQMGFSIIYSNENEFLVIAENNENYICYSYDEGMDEIKPLYLLINKNNVISIRRKQLAPLKISSFDFIESNNETDSLNNP